MQSRTLIALVMAGAAATAMAGGPPPSAAASAPPPEATSDAAASPPSALEAAQRARPGVQWQADSELEGDFDCSGRASTVLLGTSKTEVTVAVFKQGVDGPPIWLSYPAHAIAPASVMLTTEDLDFDPARFARENGAVPAGLEPSLTCEGLNLTDMAPHSIHIYWDRRKGRYADWRQ
ncbi:MAG: hypothetical protein KGN16_25860 [Burkholderiales bacterium]|nr:hypothetical protein [Burkholderiales bacterium]